MAAGTTLRGTPAARRRMDSKLREAPPPRHFPARQTAIRPSWDWMDLHRALLP